MNKETNKSCAVASGSASVDDLATLVRRLVYELRKLNPDNICASDSLDYLTRHGLIGSPMRKPNIRSQTGATDAAK